MRLLSTMVATAAFAIMTSIASALNPKYEGGYPTEETASAAFEEYDYHAATQFYVWAYAYLNSLGFEKGLSRLGGDGRTIYIFDNAFSRSRQLSRRMTRSSMCGAD